jgi:hypothetical protein
VVTEGGDQVGSRGPHLEAHVELVDQRTMAVFWTEIATQGAPVSNVEIQPVFDVVSRYRFARVGPGGSHIDVALRASFLKAIDRRDF